MPGRAGFVAPNAGAVATIDGEFGYGQVVGVTMGAVGALL